MKIIKSTVQPPEFAYTFPKNVEETAFFDIETTGLSAKASSLYLIGAMHYNNNTGEWQLIQWFANDYQSEKNILLAFLEFLEKFCYLYHFNGKTFDIPYIVQKCERHAIIISEHNKNILKDTSGVYSIDLLKHIRRLRRPLLLDKCSQTAIENWLGCKRTDTFNGGDLIPVYSEYMQQRILAPEKADALEKVLLLHNHDDVKMMLEVCSVLSYEYYLLYPDINPAFHPNSLSRAEISTRQDSMTIILPAVIPVPKKITVFASYPGITSPSEEEKQGIPSLSDAVLTLDRTECRITLPVYHGELKYFYPNPKDYYYLPKEDMAIHKDIAEFVDKQYRRKATSATCYARHEGNFLPCLAPCKKSKKTEETPKELPRFFLTYRDRLSFHQLPEDYQENPDFWQIYLTEELRAFL